MSSPDGLSEEFGVAAKVGKPQVVYRETITRTVTVEGRFDREIGEKLQTGHVVLELAPLPNGSGVIFEATVPDGTIPSEFIPNIEQSVRRSAMAGVLGGYPVVDVRVTFCGGSFDTNTSTALGYEVAAAQAFSRRLSESPACFARAHHGRGGRRARRISGRRHQRLVGPQSAELRASPRSPAPKSWMPLVPLSKMFGYSTELRSLSQGRATFSMHFARFDRATELPPGAFAHRLPVDHAVPIAAPSPAAAATGFSPPFCAGCRDRQAGQPSCRPDLSLVKRAG